MGWQVDGWRDKKSEREKQSRAAGQSQETEEFVLYDSASSGD
jgi:hypothetical protein